MSNEEVTSIILWAESLAITYDLGVNVIVNSFIKANKQLKDTVQAKIFIESELRNSRKERAVQR